MNKQAEAPIGIFDSGIGGLTVAQAVMDELPHEDIIYFGDTARVPYGIKSEKTIRQYALQITNFLLEQKVKMLLVACNSVSASALQTILDQVPDLPVLDVISAGTDAALVDNSQKVGIIGTLATIGSHAYEMALKSKNPEIEVISEACPLLVPLAEEGWIDNEVARETLQIYLAPFKRHSPDTLILGCTHYPLFKDAIRRQLANPDIRIIDSALSIAHSTRKTLEKYKLTNPQSATGNFRCYVSDKPQRFQQLAERFLGRKIPDVHVVSLS